MKHSDPLPNLSSVTSSSEKRFQEPFSSDAFNTKIQEGCLYLTASFMIHPIRAWQVKGMVDVVVMIFSNCSLSLWPMSQGWRLDSTEFNPQLCH